MLALSWARARASSSAPKCSIGARELAAEDRHQLRDLVFAGAGIDAEDAAVAVRMREGVDRIDEAALLADLLEEPRGHAAAQRGREHVRRPVVGSACGTPREAEDEMHLFEVAVLADSPPAVAGGLGFRLRSRRVAR